MSLLDVLDRPRSRGPQDAPAPVPRPDGPGQRPRSGRFNWLLQPKPETVITLLVVGMACLFTFVQLQPSKLFSTSTPAGGDMGAHVWQPAYLRDHLLTHWRLTGWAPSWYAGFPSLVFYFPLPSLFIVLLNTVLPYGVAFKLVSVAGLVTLPIGAWAFGRLSRMPFPGPACLAAATLPFLFSREFTIYGGNIASTLAGEFAFSISLVGALVFLGLVTRGLDTGRYRAWAAVVLTLTGLCHLLPTIFALLGAVVLTVMRGDRRRWLWTVPTLAVAACLAGFWSLPFLLRLPYATDMGYEKVTVYWKNLFPHHLLWLPAMAALGVLLSVLRSRRLGMFLGIMAVLSAVIFVIAPPARLWNARVLPFWFLCLYLLAGVAVAETGSLVAQAVSGTDVRVGHRWALLPVPVAAVVLALIWVGYPLRILPFGHVDARTAQYNWLGISSSDKSFIPDWVRWNYSGYESTGKARRDEYFALVKIMSDLGSQPGGCGRAMWEYEAEEDQMGTPMALMLLPYWTHGCVDSMEGLYFESSATTPYHFINASELSLHASDPVRGLTYASSPDVTEGVAHLQLLGVKYYMALTPETQTQADANGDLRLVATSGPWPVTYYSGNTPTTKQRTWKIYEIANSDVVSPLLNQPVVMRGAPAAKDWLQASEKWYLDPSRRDVLYAASGPSSWARVSPTEANPPRTPLEPTLVSNIKTTDDSVSFDVDTVGVPVLVKTSYFPNWHASGAKGPWRVTPNLMVVIPTSRHVRLHYGYTPVDLFGLLFSLVGLAGVVWLAKSKRVRFRAARRPPAAAAMSGTVPTSPWVGADGADPYARLQTHLAGAFEPPGGGEQSASRQAEDLDLWLGFPAGLDLARYHVMGYGVPSHHPDGLGGDQQSPGGGEPFPAPAGNGGAVPEEPENGAPDNGAQRDNGAPKRRRPLRAGDVDGVRPTAGDGVWGATAWDEEWAATAIPEAGGPAPSTEHRDGGPSEEGSDPAH